MYEYICLLSMCECVYFLTPLGIYAKLTQI